VSADSGGTAHFQPTKMAAARAGGLECKTLTSLDQESNSIEHDSASGSCGSTRIERRQSPCDFIRVDKFGQAKMLREKIRRHRRLAGAVWPSDDDDLFHFGSYAAKSATTASSTGKPDGVTRKKPSPSFSTKPSAVSPATRSGSSGRPAKA
jgi:hypothetical protein